MPAQGLPLRKGERLRPAPALTAREAASGRVLGAVNLSEIVAGAFHNVYLGYCGAALA